MTKRMDAPFTPRNKNPNMLEGLASIAHYIGKSPNTTRDWIRKHGLPATKTPGGVWLSNKMMVMMWIYAGHQAEVKGYQEKMDPTAFGDIFNQESYDKLAEMMNI